MENVNCNLCGSSEVQVLFRKKDKFGIAEDEFRVVECQGCGLLYISPRPSQQEIGKFYPETYSWKETVENDSLFVRWVRRLEKGYRYHLLKDEVSKAIKYTQINLGKVLDIGCGTGDRLDVFRRRGFETYGVETSASADYGQDHLKLNIVRGDLFSAHFPDNHFDVVTLYNVLEHTHNPLEVCKEIYRILKKDGFLVIQIPNKNSIQCKLFKKRWAAFDVPRDLYYFGIGTLDLLFRKSGFKTMRINHLTNWWHPPTLVISLFPNLDPQRAWRKEGKGRSSFLQRVGWVFCTVLAGFFTQLEGTLRRGAIVTCYTVKDEG